MNPLAPLSANLQDPQTVAFVTAFERSVRRAKVEHMWTLLGDGRTVKAKGTRDSVPSPNTGDQLVLLEIHQHPIDELEDRPQDTGFLHLHDIGASFNAPGRVFGTYLVLVQAPSGPYVVASSFSPESRQRLFKGDLAPHTKVYERIQRVHARPAVFARKVAGSENLHALKKAYERLLPELEFALCEIDRGRLLPLSS